MQISISIKFFLDNVFLRGIIIRVISVGSFANLAEDSRRNVRCAKIFNGDKRFSLLFDNILLSRVILWMIAGGLFANLIEDDGRDITRAKALDGGK